MLYRILTLTRLELYKLSRQKFSYLLIAFIVFNAALVGIGSRIFPALMASMSGGEGPSFDGYTFASIIATGTFSSAGAGTIAMLAFSGSMVASETESGTLRNILTRPVNRADFILAKALALFVYCLIIVAVTAILSITAGALLYGMGNVSIAETGEVYRTRPEMFFNMGVSYMMDLFSIYTVACLGLFLSVLINNAGWAVITPLVIYFPVMFLKNFNFFSRWVFTAYMDEGQNILREMVVVKSKTWFPDIYAFFAVDVLTIALFIGCALAAFKNKEIH
jgi:ABC-2 type transport system permease protein